MQASYRVMVLWNVWFLREGHSCGPQMQAGQGSGPSQCPPEEDLAKPLFFSFNLSRPQQLTAGSRDQALSLWSGSTDSKTPDYQTADPREYQMVRTHTKETTWIQDPASPNHPVHDASSKQQTNKMKIQTQSSVDRITTSLSLPHQRKDKQTQTKTQHKSHLIPSLHKPLNQP